MADKLAIHVAPEANPDNLTALITSMYENDAIFSSASEMLEYADSLGIGSRVEMSITATQMGLIERTSTEVKLSSAGKALAQIGESLRGEILHIIMYSGWHSTDPKKFLPSWAYRQICDEYWRCREIVLDASANDQQVTQMISTAESTFSELGIHDFAGISFSRKSLSGARKWLEALNPPVIADGRFEYREFCPPQTLLLAFGFVMRDELEALDVDILLSHDRREALCRACLLNPTNFDQVLDWMLPLYPHIITADNEVGYYGRYVRLHKLPTLEDLVL